MKVRNVKNCFKNFYDNKETVSLHAYIQVLLKKDSNKKVQYIIQHVAFLFATLKQKLQYSLSSTTV